MSQSQAPVDVLVIGGGVAGSAAALALAREGLRVRCVEPSRFPRARVGESLDWSAPKLLSQVGLDRDTVVASGAGTYKREVHGITSSGRRLVAGPPRWFRSWPLRFENVTLHVDREQFDQRLLEAAVDAGVEFVWERIHTVQLVDDRVRGCSTSSGTSHEADWYVDASGRSRLIGKAAHIGTRRWGHERIGIWTQRSSPTPVEGTILHLDDMADDLAWAWQIPIDRDRTSVGVVAPLDAFKALRREEASVEQVFARLLERFPNLEGPPNPGPVMTRVFQPCLSERVVGANWMMVGEAASIIDPLSSLGVTAALRHGTEAAEIITRSLQEPDATCRLLSGYDQRVRGVAVLYNDSLDTLLYRAGPRRRLGIKQAARAYVILGYLANALYTRLRPDRSRIRHAAMTLVLAFFRAWTRSWSAAARATQQAPTSKNQ